LAFHEPGVFRWEIGLNAVDPEQERDWFGEFMYMNRTIYAMGGRPVDGRNFLKDKMTPQQI
jgi:hypothetical protein